MLIVLVGEAGFSSVVVSAAVLVAAVYSRASGSRSGRLSGIGGSDSDVTVAVIVVVGGFLARALVRSLRSGRCESPVIMRFQLYDASRMHTAGHSVLYSVLFCTR